jgi:hypothetical protein
MRTILICKPGSAEDHCSGELARLAPSRIQRLLCPIGPGLPLYAVELKIIFRLLRAGASALA